MRKLLLGILLFLCLASFVGADTTVVVVQGVSGGEAAPDVTISMDSSNADCSTVGWTAEIDGGNVTCDDTTHRDGGSGYALKASGGQTTGASYAFGEAKTELWLEFYLYVNDGDSTWDATNRLFGFDDTANADVPQDLFIHVRDSTGYKWGGNWGGGNSYGSVAANPTQNMLIRLHVIRSDDVGVVELWESVNAGVDWTKKVDLSSQDTANGESWTHLQVGYNNGNNLPCDWHFDTVKIWYSDPNWSF